LNTLIPPDNANIPFKYYLNDVICNSYISLLNDKAGNTKYCFNTQFYQMLVDNRKVENHESVDISKLDLLAIPINFSKHWTLVVINFIKKFISYIDSFPNSENGHRVLLVIQNYLWQKFRDNTTKLDEIKNYTVKPQASSNSVQKNGYDCGIHMIHNIRMAFFDENLVVDKKTRPNIAKELLKNKLDN